MIKIPFPEWREIMNRRVEICNFLHANVAPAMPNYVYLNGNQMRSGYTTDDLFGGWEVIDSESERAFLVTVLPEEIETFLALKYGVK